MNTVRVTITDRTVLPTGTHVTLRKEPENTYDCEAIAVYDALTKVGYVSAYYKTRQPNTISAGRIYDRFEQELSGKVVAPHIVELTLP